VFDKCAWVAGIIQKHVAGEPVSFDASDLVAELVEVSGGRVRCRLCGRVVRLGMLKHHLRSKHCSRLLELLEKRKLRRDRAYGRGDGFTFNIKFCCTGCGWSHTTVVKSYTGPPNIRKLLEKLGLASCPNCGRVFDVSRVEFGFEGV
jgi:transcription elongation factor Elf1